MRITGQIGILMGFCMLGEWIGVILPFSFPSSVISMLLLFLFLFYQWLKVKQIQSVAEYILSNMSLFFIPSAVSLMNRFETIKNDFLKIFFVIFISTLLTFMVTGYTVMLFQKLEPRGKQNE